MKNKRRVLALVAFFVTIAASKAGAAILSPRESAVTLSPATEIVQDQLTVLSANIDRLQGYTTPVEREPMLALQSDMFAELEQISNQLIELQRNVTKLGVQKRDSSVREVPFFSQFADIASPQWQKVGCGIASVAMLIEYYNPGEAEVETLLQQGRSAGYFLSDAGWTHAGLINLSQPFGLMGESKSLAALGSAAAFNELTKVLQEGPVMASVHYTFEPTNPIPHLVVVNSVQDGLVYYNDPAEASGGGVISIEKFQRAWKQRYIEIRPVS